MSELHTRLRGLQRGLWLACWLTACSTLDVSVGAWQPDAGDDVPQSDAAEPLDADVPDVSMPQLDPFYLEAESAQLSGDFRVLSDLGASAGKLLAAPTELSNSADATPAEARAVYSFELGRAGDYLIWGRIRSPNADHNRFWFALDAGPWIKWRISVGDIWYWDDLHDDTNYGTPLHFALEAGPHRLVLAPAVPLVELDRLYITAAGGHPPGNSTACFPPHSIELQGECFPSCGAQRGDMCGEPACTGLPRIQAYDCDTCCRSP